MDPALSVKQPAQEGSPVHAEFHLNRVIDSRD
jgi:hypothetical protein